MLIRKAIKDMNSCHLSSQKDVLFSSLLKSLVLVLVTRTFMSGECISMVTKVYQVYYVGRESRRMENRSLTSWLGDVGSVVRSSKIEVFRL